MSEPPPEPLRADILARLLMIQSTAGQLPDESAVVAFVCRGLEMVPGVAKVWLEGTPGNDDQLGDGLQRFPVRFGRTDRGYVFAEIGEPSRFVPYVPHVQNLLFIVAVMLEERRQRHLTEVHQQELEERVATRTRELTREIQERAAAEAKALSEKRRAEDYLEISEAIIVELDVAGRVLVANKRLCSLLGYPPHEVMGKDWFEVAIAGADRAAMRGVFDQMMQGRVKLVEYYENPIFTREGQLIHVEWHNVLRLEGDQIVGTLSSGVDVTERKRYEGSLAAERDQLAVTLRSIGDGVITTDMAGQILVMNPVAEMLTGWRQEEAKGRPLPEVFAILDERNHEPCSNPVERVLSTFAPVELANHTQLVSRDGTQRSISDCAAPIRDLRGDVIGVVLVFRDVTERYRLIEQVQRAQRLDAIGVLAGGIAHDFNNMLTGLFGYISLARDIAMDNAPLIGALDDAMEVFERAQTLTRQLLTFSKGGTPVRSVVNLRRLLTDCTKFALSGSNVLCNLSFAVDLPQIEADANQLWRVIDNLVRNAVQAMPSGGTVEVRCRQVELCRDEGNAIPSGQYVLITVKDDGPGIPNEILPKIFDPFFTTKVQGTGLGLATAYSVIRKHNGHIEAHSEQGQGTSFEIYLPMVPLSAPVSVGSKSGRAHVGHGRALVLEDDPHLGRLFAQYLSNMGYSVTTTQDGRDAIAQADEAVASGTPFVVALFDLTVPGGMGGQAAILPIRSQNPQLVAVASSGYSESEVMATPSAFGFTASLAKPFTALDLGALLEQHLPSGK